MKSIQILNTATFSSQRKPLEQKLHGNPKFDLFHQVQIVQKLVKSTTVTEIKYILNVVRKVQQIQIWGQSFPAFSRKYTETPNLIHSYQPNLSKFNKISRLWPKSTTQFWSWSWYISMQNLKPCQKKPRNPKYDQFYWVKFTPKLGK